MACCKNKFLIFDLPIFLLREINCTSLFLPIERFFLRKLVEELGCALFLVSHLRRPEGKGHEDGVQVSLSHLGGSHSLATLADCVIAFERNQQDEINRNVMRCRVLKNRFSGDTGIACNLIYNTETGRLTEGSFDE